MCLCVNVYTYNSLSRQDLVLQKYDTLTQKGSNEHLFILTITVCKFLGKSPLSSHRMTLKQQINGRKRWKMKAKDLTCFGWVFTACSVLGRLLATEIHYYYKLPAVQCYNQLHLHHHLYPTKATRCFSSCWSLWAMVSSCSPDTDTRMRLHW